MYPSYAKLVFPSNISIDKRQENTCSFVKKKREREKRRIQLCIKVINREDNGKWKIVEFKPIKRNLFHFGTRGTSSSIPGCSPFPEFLDPLSFHRARLPRERARIYRRNVGFIRSRYAWACLDVPPCPPLWPYR